MASRIRAADDGPVRDVPRVSGTLRRAFGDELTPDNLSLGNRGTPGGDIPVASPASGGKRATRPSMRPNRRCSPTFSAVGDVHPTRDRLSPRSVSCRGSPRHRSWRLRRGHGHGRDDGPDASASDSFHAPADTASGAGGRAAGPRVRPSALGRDPRRGHSPQSTVSAVGSGKSRGAAKGHAAPTSCALG